MTDGAIADNTTGKTLTITGEVQLDEKTVNAYKDALTEKILAVGRELDSLNARMMNPNYVDKAPRNLVKETEDAIKEKSALIDRLKQQLSLI